MVGKTLQIEAKVEHKEPPEHPDRQTAVRLKHQYENQHGQEAVVSLRGAEKSYR